MDNTQNILVINFGGIGDEILFLPTLISLRKTYPNAKITLALEPRSKGIKDLTWIIDDLILIDVKGKNKYSELLKLVSTARKSNFDMVISSGGNKFISVLLAMTGIKKRYGYNTGLLSRLLLTNTVVLDKNQYACNMYHQLIAPVSNEWTFLPEFNIEEQEKIPNSILIHPGVSKLSVQKGMIKTVGAKVWAETIELLLEKGKHVILAGGPDDKDVIEEIMEILGDKINDKNFENTYGQTKNLRDLAVLIGKAEKFLCSDSAPMHIGVGMKTRTYAIFGPTDDKMLIPQSELVTAIKTQDKCPLKPCLWAKRQTTCETLDCLKITAQDIVNTIEK